jgi:hypothetical protein
MDNIETQALSEITQQLRVVNAYQHFLYYIDTNHIKEYDPWKGSGLLSHFMEKLTFYTAGESFISTRCVVMWFQDMNKSYQADLLKYIMKFHADKY